MVPDTSTLTRKGTRNTGGRACRKVLSWGTTMVFVTAMMAGRDEIKSRGQAGVPVQELTGGSF